MTLGFSVDELLPRARGGGPLKIGLAVLRDDEWLQPDPDLAVRNAAFDAHRESTQVLPQAVAAGISIPIVAGIMPIRNVKGIKRFTQICGASIPPGLLAKIEAVEDDDEAVAQIGMLHAVRQCEALLDQGVAGLHFYTLNRSTATRAIVQEVKSRL